MADRRRSDFLLNFDNVRNSLFLLFKSAIDSERKAQDMYKRANELTDDEDFKEILESFYQDELRHERKLMDQYNKMVREFSIPEE